MIVYKGVEILEDYFKANNALKTKYKHDLVESKFYKEMGYDSKQFTKDNHELRNYIRSIKMKRDVGDTIEDTNTKVKTRVRKVQTVDSSRDAKQKKVPGVTERLLSLRKH